MKNYDNILLITENLHNLYSEGIDLSKAIDIIIGLPLSSNYKKSLIKIREDIILGVELCEAIKKHPKLYPKEYISILEIGEKSGKLDKVLYSLTKYCEKKSLIKKKILSVSIYPSILLLLLVICIFAMIFIINPIFVENLGDAIANDSLIISTYNFRNYVNSNVGYCLINLLSYILIVIIIFTIFKDKINILSRFTLYKLYYENILITVLEVIFSSGIPLLNALKMCSESLEEKNTKKDICSIYNMVLQGNTLFEAMDHCKFISVKTKEIIKVAEKGGYILEIITKLQLRLEKELNQKIDKFLSKLQPASIILISLVVGGFLLVFILPMLTSMNKVS